MKYTYNNKTYIIPDNEIDIIMEKFKDISISEACEVYLSDKDLININEIEELEAKAKKNRIMTTIHGAKGEKKERKPREKKENPLKKTIIDILFNALKAKEDYFDAEISSFIVRNDEKYIDFTLNDRSFTVNLVEHRKKKG